MTHVVLALGVYKVVQIIDALLPREVMPWVKIIAATVLSYGACSLYGTENIWIDGVAVATLSGTVHSVLRLVTLGGDVAHKKSLR